MSTSRPDALRHHACPLESAWKTGWHPILAFVLSTLAISMLLSVFAIPLVRLTWWMTFRRCVSIGAGVSLLLLVHRREKRSLRSYGFSDLRTGKRQFAFGALLGLSGLALLFVIGVLTGACQIDITHNQWRLWRTVISFVPLAVLVGILEEIIFRGYILQHLLRHSKVLAIVTSSALYAVVHVKVLELTGTACLELIGLFLLGVVLCLSYLLTQQLYLAVGLHSMLAYGARVNKLFVDLPNSYASIAWLAGTSRLINGIASWILLLVIGGVLILWTRTRGGFSHGSL